MSEARAALATAGPQPADRERAGLGELLVIWDNPVFLRYWCSRLRLRKAVFWYLLTLIVTTFIVMLTYIIRTNQGTPPQDVAADLWLPLLIIQGLILMIKGTGAVSAGLIQDKLDQTLDYQRLTPMTPLRSLLGYLYGLPVLEYVMVALTLPHLLFIVAVGEIPLLTVFQVYLAFFTCVTLYHVTSIAVGMVMRRWIWGYLLSILMVGLVNVVLPTFIAQLGLKFLQYLSVWPVIGQKVAPLMFSPAMLAQASQNPWLAMADAVPFYDWSLSPFVFTLLLQGALIVTFAVMALRRWQSSTRHSLSKPYALAFLCGFIVLVIGNVWQAITGQRLPFPIFGETRLDQLSETIAIGLPVVYCFVVWLLCIVLFSIVTPTHHACVRGIRRAHKLGREAPAAWDDDATHLAFMALFVVVALLGFGVLVREIHAAGFFDFLTGSGFAHWRLPLAFGLALVYTVLLLQVAELRPSVLVILLVWFLPVLVAVVFGAAMQLVGPSQAVIAAISPIVMLFAAGMMPIVQFAPPGAVEEVGALTTAANAGLIFITAQIVWLWRRRRRHQIAFELAGRARGYEATEGSRPASRGKEAGPVQPEGRSTQQ